MTKIDWDAAEARLASRTDDAAVLEGFNTVFPHPTLSEMMHEAVLDAYGRAIHF